jgi:iron-sulfur cluster repair protein YtfE (RIC family)
MPSAIDLLRDDHRRVEEIFDRIEQAPDRLEKDPLFEEACAELEAHMHLEETLLYPLFAERPGYIELIEDAYDEHQEAKELIREIRQATTDESFIDQLDELIEAVLHHVDEEESEVFPRLMEELGEARLETIGARMLEMKATPRTAQAA